MRYEELRSHVLSGSTTWHAMGLALFLRSGMAAWLRTCAELCPAGSSTRTDANEPAVDLPPDTSREIVLTLANMVLGAG